MRRRQSRSVRDWLDRSIFGVDRSEGDHGGRGSSDSSAMLVISLDHYVTHSNYSPSSPSVPPPAAA